MKSIQELETGLRELSGKTFVSLSFYDKVKEQDFQDEAYYMIGNDYEAEIGVKKSNGEVYSLLEDDIVFMNSSLTMLIHFMEIFSKIIDFDGDYVESKRKRDTREISRQFKTIDRKAVKEGAWWAFILEQTEDGLL